MQQGRTGRTTGVIFFLLLCAAALFSLAQPATAATTSGNAGSVWGAGYFPDAQLVTSDGKTVRFFTDLVKGKVVLINFIYTSCPDECALETARLREVQKILGDRVGRDVFLYSITIDPAHDTPKVLKAYAEQFQVGPGWLFLTGKDSDITQLRKKLGLYTDPDTGGKLVDHNLSLIMGNQSTGQWMKVSPYENPYVIATQLGSWLSNWKMPQREQDSYAAAPKLRTLSTGEELFRTRCSACHTIGAKEAKGSGKRALGPDLLGVTQKRDKKWLTRWLAETDKVLAERDPLAMELLARYNNLPMPNLRLTGTDVEALLAYLEAESQRLEHQHEHHHAGGHHDGHGHSHGAGHDHGAEHDHDHGAGHDGEEHDHSEEHH